MRGVVQKKNGLFTVRLTIRVFFLTTPLIVAVLKKCYFGCVGNVYVRYKVCTTNSHVFFNHIIW